ncbi:AraC family transcriptional regulator [Pelagibius sp. Alg239-R121]|uniref:AraC family transcriptional regulator n=1 Tax=Pelagibius sp. Alg239-R121 TaxID=2993448 RepID=UPI0024A63C96|nr:AraC family transcriptional regulator [Pelagibius sp. Alg239-R121]
MNDVVTANRSILWSDGAVPGTLMMRADFTTLEFAPHVHDELVIAVTEAGGSRFRSRGVEDHAEPDTLLVFNPDEPHSGRVGDHNCWRYRAIYLSTAALDEAAEGLELRMPLLPYFQDNKLLDSELARRFVALHQTFEQGDATLTKSSSLLEALAELFERHGTPHYQPKLPGEERQTVARLIEFLSAHFSQDVTLAQLAELAGMTAFHVIRCFNRETGLSPHAYLNQLRLREARRLLAIGRRPAEVALMVGFYDQSALNRHFRKAFSVTPGQYAQALAGSNLD